MVGRRARKLSNEQTRATRGSLVFHEALNFCAAAPTPTGMPYCERKVGAFREWTEDHEQAEIALPLPPGTTKKDLVCVIGERSLIVKDVNQGITLLNADPLAGLAVPEAAYERS